MLASRYCMLASRYCMLASRYCMLASRYCKLASRYCMLASRYCIAKFCSRMLWMGNVFLKESVSVLNQGIKIALWASTLILVPYAISKR